MPSTQVNLCARLHGSITFIFWKKHPWLLVLVKCHTYSSLQDPFPKECGGQCPPLVLTCMHREPWTSILMCIYYAHTMHMYKMYATHIQRKYILPFESISSWKILSSFCPTLLTFKISLHEILFYFQSCKYVSCYHLCTHIIFAVSDWIASISWPVLLSFIRKSQRHFEEKEQRFTVLPDSQQRAAFSLLLLGRFFLVSHWCYFQCC